MNEPPALASELIRVALPLTSMRIRWVTAFAGETSPKTIPPGPWPLWLSSHVPRLRSSCSIPGMNLGCGWSCRCRSSGSQRRCGARCVDGKPGGAERSIRTEARPVGAGGCDGIEAAADGAGALETADAAAASTAMGRARLTGSGGLVRALCRRSWTVGRWMGSSSAATRRPRTLQGGRPAAQSLTTQPKEQRVLGLHYDNGERQLSIKARCRRAEQNRGPERRGQQRRKRNNPGQSRGCFVQVSDSLAR